MRVAYEAGHEVMVCSLTRTAAAEVAGRDLPIDNNRVGTLHSHAYRSLAGSFTGIADTPKYINEWNQEHPKMALSGGDRDLDEDNASPFEGRSPGDERYNAMNCYRARMIPEANWLTETRAFHKQWCEWKQANDLIDFTDMLEIALDTIPIAPGNPDVIFADESQDFSALEMALLNQWGVKAGRLVVVGDPWQALYEWRGSDPAVFFEGEIPPDNYRILKQSYRVPRVVHRAAMDWLEKMPGYEPIEYFPTEEEGQVSGLEASWRSFNDALPIIEQALAHDKEVMILTSCAYMLEGVIKLLRAEGVPFHNEYRRKNGAWNPLARRGSNVTSSDRLAAFLRMGEEGFWTREDLRTWLSGMKCSEILPTKQSFKKFEPILNNLNEGAIPYGLVEALVGESICEYGMGFDIHWYLNCIQKSRYSSALLPCAIYEHMGMSGLTSSPKVTIGTIHSVKGGEADVVILAPDVSQQGAESWSSSVAGRAAIYRLFYVGMTRAKESLHIMNPVTEEMAVRLL